MKTTKKTSLYESPMKERNEEKYGLIDNQCICCGKPMKENNNLFVHMGTDWNAYNTNLTKIINGIGYIEGTNQETQGIFPIGNDCAKKMKGFTFTI